MEGEEKKKREGSKGNRLWYFFHADDQMKKERGKVPICHPFRHYLGERGGGGKA